MPPPLLRASAVEFERSDRSELWPLITSLRIQLSVNGKIVIHGVLKRVHDWRSGSGRIVEKFTRVGRVSPAFKEFTPNADAQKCSKDLRGLYTFACVGKCQATRIKTPKPQGNTLNCKQTHPPHTRRFARPAHSHSLGLTTPRTHSFPPLVGGVTFVSRHIGRSLSPRFGAGSFYPPSRFHVGFPPPPPFYRKLWVRGQIGVYKMGG